MAAASVSSAGRSEPGGRIRAFLDDPARGVCLEIAGPPGAEGTWTLGEALSSFRSGDRDGLAGTGLVDSDRVLEWERCADSLFLLEDDGRLGGLDPGLRFRVEGRAIGVDERIDAGRPDGGAFRIEVDRSRSGYTRNWTAYLSRRWRLREVAYRRFVESAVERVFGDDAADVLRVDSPDRIRRFLHAVSKRIHASPYETYSRYLGGGTPFKSCDQTLDRILDGDGGICAEKAMALYFIAHAYGIPAEFVLGGEEASGSFPYRTLRSLLDRPSFAFEGTAEAQRYWQHYAVRCPLPDGESVFCDVAASNIPMLCWGAHEAAPYLDTVRKRPLRVTITLDPIDLYYHRIGRRQDLALDLYYAMEHLIDGIDLIQTFDNELGLLHTGDFWVGAIAHRGRRELSRIVGEYERHVSRSGRDPADDLGIAGDLSGATHPAARRFARAHPRLASRLDEADPGLRRRLRSGGREYELAYVVLGLPGAS